MRSLDRNPASTCIERAGSSRGSVLQYTGTVMIITIISILRALGVRKLVTTQKKILQNRMLILKVPLKHHGPSHAPSSSKARELSPTSQAFAVQENFTDTQTHTHTQTHTQANKQAHTHTHTGRDTDKLPPLWRLYFRHFLLRIFVRIVRYEQVHTGSDVQTGMLLQKSAEVEPCGCAGTNPGESIKLMPKQLPILLWWFLIMIIV